MGGDALKVWTNGTDTVIASDRADVLAILKSHYGDDEEFDRDDWRTHPDDKVLRIHWEDQPEGVDPWVSKTCSEWIASEGRGFLCSTEY